MPSSTICRRIKKRNRGKKGYRHKQANKLAVERRQTAHNLKVDSTCQGLDQPTEQDLSPQQAVDYLNKGISLHETVYQYIYREANGGQLHQHLRIANNPIANVREK